MALENFTDDVEVISKLGDDPNLDDGLSADALKAKFDEGSRLIKKFLNDFLIPEINKMLPSTELNTAIETALQAAKDSGAFDGTDGRGIEDVELDEEGRLFFNFTDGTSQEVGNVIGPAGADGTSCSVSVEETDSGYNMVVTTGTASAAYPVYHGADGADGKSAYEVAVENGFEGTEDEWLESLKGKDGKDGASGDEIFNIYVTHANYSDFTWDKPFGEIHEAIVEGVVVVGHFIDTETGITEQLTPTNFDDDGSIEFHGAYGYYELASGGSSWTFYPKEGDSGVDMDDRGDLSPVAIGFNYQKPKDMADYNLAVGFRNFGSSATGQKNMTVGTGNMRTVTGSQNTSIGYHSQFRITSGRMNVSVGNESLDDTTTGSQNTAIGAYAMQRNAVGNNNTVVGYYAMRGDNDVFSETKNYNNNVVVGKGAAGAVQTCENSVVIGSEAGQVASEITNSVIIGKGAVAGRQDAITGCVVIGCDVARATNPSNQLFIANSSANKYSAIIFGEFNADAALQLLRFNAGTIMMPKLPTTKPATIGCLWNDNGTLKIS